MLTEKMGGIFDCRAYDQSGKLTHDQRRMLADTDNITFSVLLPINQVPDMFKQNGALDEFARPKASRKEREDADHEHREPVNDVVSIKFKIGANCKWFGADTEPIQRPTNAELEASRWMVQIDFNRKAKDASNPLKPAGYWCNAIMVQKVEENPFKGKGFVAATEPIEAETVAAEPAPMPTPEKKEESTDGLPF